MTERDKLIVYLSRLEISNKKIEKILENCGSMQGSMQLNEALKSDVLLKTLSQEEYHKAVQYDKVEFESSLANMEKQGIDILTIFDERYPKSLIDLPDRPLVLFAKGDLSLLEKKCVAIVGTRMPSNYGKIVTDKFAGELAKSGLVIVSGLCYGVDEIAHRKTLDVGGKTIAIVGSGFNNIYPAKNTALAREIAEKGLLLSEYTPSFTPKRYTFPQRNRIVAGVSSGVLITEAGLKSGTLHTKEFALEYGKDIFVVPGNINSEKSQLPNELIKSGQAECVTSPDDIIEYYGMKKQAKENKVVQLSFDERKILDLLSNGEKDIDYLAEKSGIPVNILNSCLTTLEIRGLIKRLPAKMFAAN